MAVGSNLIQVEGTLIGNGQHRMQDVDHDGHMVPVLLLDVRLHNDTHNHVRVEQVFPVGDEASCAAAARRYRKGQRVQVQAPVAWAVLHLRRAAHIHIVSPTTTTTTEETTV